MDRHFHRLDWMRRIEELLSLGHGDRAEGADGRHKSGGPSKGGLESNKWAAVVNRDGVVCAITFSGHKAGDRWPGAAPEPEALALASVPLSWASIWGSGRRRQRRPIRRRRPGREHKDRRSAPGDGEREAAYDHALDELAPH